MAAASDGHAAAIEFDGFIETCFLSLEETNYESCVTALVGAEAALSRMKKSTKLDAARRRHEIAATDNTAREEVLSSLRRKVIAQIDAACGKCREADQCSTLWQCRSWLGGDVPHTFFVKQLTNRFLEELDTTQRQLASQRALSSLSAPASAIASDSDGTNSSYVRAVVAVLSFSAGQMQEVSDLRSPSGPRVKVIQELYDGIDPALSGLFEQCAGELSLEGISHELCDASQDADAGGAVGYATALGKIDTALDQAAFLLQAVERYLRLVSSFLLSGHVGQPSSIRGKLSESAQALMGQFVQCEQAFVAQQMVWTLSNSSLVEIQADVFVDGWVDTVFYILRQSVSRCASTYSKMTAAASLNHIVGLFEDHLQPAFQMLLHLCLHAVDEPVPQAPWLQASSVFRNEDMLPEPAPADSDPSQGAGETSMLVVSKHACRSMNSAALVVCFAQQLASVVRQELSDIFSNAEAASPTTGSSPENTLAPILSMGIQQLDEAANRCDSLWEGCMYDVVRRHLGAQLGTFVHALRSSSFNIPPDQYDHVLSHHGLFRLFEQAVLTESGLVNLLPHVSAEVKGSLGKAVSKQLDDLLCGFLVLVKCNELGGMYMNRLLADIRAALQTVGIGKGARSAFTRTSQCIAILCSSSVDEACQLYFPVPALTQKQVRGLLHNRIDFLAPDVQQADLSSLALLD